MNANILDTQLSPHFRLSEFVRSGTAIRLHIDNSPSVEVIQNLRALCVNVLEPLRCRFGVIRITSGYRSVELNKAVHGVPHSQHILGEACDIHISSLEVANKMFKFVRENLPFDQLLFEHRRSDGAKWLHVSYKRESVENRAYCCDNYAA